MTHATKHIYLAGPIAGCTEGEANDWREHVSDRLRVLGYVGISPLRCEPLIGERYGTGNDDPRFGTARAISSKNLADVQSCDLTFAYMPKPEEGRPPSVGTIIEIAWANAFRKPVVLVTTDPYILAHPVVNACASWILESLDDGLDVVDGLFHDYVHGPRSKELAETLRKSNELSRRMGGGAGGPIHDI